MRGSNFNQFWERLNSYKEVDKFEKNYMPDYIMSKNIYTRYDNDYWHTATDMHGEPNGKMKHPDLMTKKDILDWYNIDDFNQGIMLNISPNWKGLKITQTMIDICKNFMQGVIDDTRCYSRYKYVLECGSDGDFLHIHAVLELNDKLARSTLSALKKGNYQRGIRKIWNRRVPEGMKGLIESRYAVQTTKILNGDIMRDKLDYLIEELKPESHQNAKHPLCPQIINGWD